MPAPSYDDLKEAVGEADCSSGVPEELVHLMDEMFLPHHLKAQIKKLLFAGNKERATKLIDAYRQHESWWGKLRRKLGI